MRLVPRQDTFFDMFEKQVKMVDFAAQMLEKLMVEYEDPEGTAMKLRAAEHDADEAAHDIIKKLNTTFVTPLDREDIHALASALDDIMDFIEAAADRMALYEVKAPTEAAIKLSKVLAQATHLTVQAVSGMRNMKNTAQTRETCVAINRLENEGDQINRKALAELFKMHDQPMEALKWREIYGHIETAIDKCEDVADIIESTVLKNA